MTTSDGLQLHALGWRSLLGLRRWGNGKSAAFLEGGDPDGLGAREGVEPETSMSVGVAPSR